MRVDARKEPAMGICRESILSKRKSLCRGPECSPEKRHEREAVAEEARQMGAKQGWLYSFKFPLNVLGFHFKTRSNLKNMHHCKCHVEDGL